ncbi:MAG: VWA domain-containing protein [Bacteroidia bacterium]|nr:VWA domain-containing protein [Bacteroidia bacterium]
MGNKKRILISGTSLLRLIFSLLLLFVSCSSSYAAPVTLRVRQAFFHYPSLTVYVDLWDESGKKVDPGPDGNISATVGNQPVKIDERYSFSTKNEGITSVFLVDISGSIKPKRFDELKQTIAAMIEKMKPLDRAAIISFGEKVTLEQDFTSEKKSLLYSLQPLKAKDQRTQLNQGLLRGLELARMKRDDLPLRRVIILCSDGIDDMPGGATQDEVRDAMALDSVPVYSIFFDSDSMSKALRETAFKTIGEFSRRSGGEVFDAKSSAFEAAFKNISTSLNESLVLKMDLSELKSDGTPRRIEIGYSDGVTSLYDGINMRFSPQPAQETATPEPKEELSGDVTSVVSEDIQVAENVLSADLTPADSDESGPIWMKYWKYLAAGSVALILLGVLLYSQKRKKQARLKKQENEKLLESAATMRVPNVSPTVSIPKVPSLRIELVVTGTSTAAGEKFTVNVADRFVLGRNSGNSALAIPGDGTISGRHCELIFSMGKLFVADLQSTNGTMVNGVPVKGEYPLNDGDRLMLGKTELRLRILGIV